MRRADCFRLTTRARWSRRLSLVHKRTGAEAGCLTRSSKFSAGCYARCSVINPLFVTYNAKGEVEGVKYDRLSIVFVNAFKEQQTQITQQQAQIETLQQQNKQQQLLIEGLRQLVCQQHSTADICR